MSKYNKIYQNIHNLREKIHNIQDLERYPNATVKVFNRWGQLLLESDGPSYPNNDFNWTELPVGTYYYIIDLGNGDSPQTGPITIIK